MQTLSQHCTSVNNRCDAIHELITLFPCFGKPDMVGSPLGDIVVEEPWKVRITRPSSGIPIKH